MFKYNLNVMNIQYPLKLLQIAVSELNSDAMDKSLLAGIAARAEPFRQSQCQNIHPIFRNHKSPPNFHVCKDTTTGKICMSVDKQRPYVVSIVFSPSGAAILRSAPLLFRLCAARDNGMSPVRLSRNSACVRLSRLSCPDKHACRLPSCRWLFWHPHKQSSC